MSIVALSCFLTHFYFDWKGTLRPQTIFISSLYILLQFKNLFIPISSASHDTLKAGVLTNNEIPSRIYLL